MKSLAESLEDIKHLHLDLTASSDDRPHRPHLSVFASNDDDDGPLVNVMVDAMFGQQARFIEMTTQEAREFSHIVLEMARAVEAEIAYGRFAEPKTVAVCSLDRDYPLPEPPKLSDELNAKIDAVLEQCKQSTNEAQKPAAHTDAFAPDGHDFENE